jgi:hypothetical protein
MIPESSVFLNPNGLKINESSVCLDPYGLKIKQALRDNGIGFSAEVWFPRLFTAGEAPKQEKSFIIPELEKDRISSTKLWSQSSNGKQYWKAVDYFSTLPHGSIPGHNIDLLKLFILHLEHKWLKLCDWGEEYLTRSVSQILRTSLN